MTETVVVPKPEVTDIHVSSPVAKHTGSIALDLRVVDGGLAEMNQPEVSELAQDVRSRMSKEGVETRKQELLSRFDAGDIQHVDRLRSAWRRALGAPIRDWKQAEVQKRRIEDIIHRTYGKSAQREHYHLERALHDIAPTVEGLRPMIDYWGDEGRTFLNELIDKSPRLNDGIDRENNSAPGLNPEATEEDFASYLGEKTFIRSRRLENASDGDSQIILRGNLDDNFKIPVSNIVSAGSFDHWFGNDKNLYGKYPAGKSYTKATGEHVIGPSEGAIMDYAHRSTPLPPLEGISAFVQPNGIVIFKADVSNHRTAAAIAQGMTEVEVEGDIRVEVINKNFIPLEQTISAEG